VAATKNKTQADETPAFLYNAANMNLELLYDAKASLGEGPIWDAKTESLYWLDIINKKIYKGADILIELDEYVGCIAPRTNGGLIFTQRASIWTLEPDSVRTTLVVTLNDEPTTTRFNDGKCDPHGRFLAGTMDLGETKPLGTLYSFDGKSITTLLSNVAISNGMAWSVDHKAFYYIDTPTREVRAFDYDLDNGMIANPRVSIYVPESLGWPDGMTSDLQGNLWIAMWGGAKITKWNPNTSELIDQISIPALNVSSCVFGGKDMNELYITTARKGMNESLLNQYPLTGGVFKLETNIEGMPAFEFAG